MNPLLVSTNDVAGGAARAAWRLHQGLRSIGVASRMRVSDRKSDDPTVTEFRPPSAIYRRIVRRARREVMHHFERPMFPADRPKFEMFSTDYSQYGGDLLGDIGCPDVLNLHWVSGMFDYRAFLRHAAGVAPLVWTLHDMNPFTGGCHFDNGCGRYSGRCGACPQLASSREWDLSRRVWNRRNDALSSIPERRLVFVTPSRWLAKQVQQSSLCGRFDVEVIPYGLESDLFRPRDQRFCRELLGVPPDARVVLFVADSLGNVRKGYDLLLQALRGLRDIDKLFLLAVGGGAADVPDFLETKVIRKVSDDRFLSVIYSAADVFVVPSRQDNLPNTVMEAMACGTPVVGFDVGGVPDMVRPGETGLLAIPFDVLELARHVARLLVDDDLRRHCGVTARRVVEAEYTLPLQATRYLQLYRRMVGAE